MNEINKIILEKIKRYILQALDFKADIDFETFSDDLKTITACVFNLVQIGELVGKLNDEFIDQNTQIPWRKIKGMRNKIVHDYDGIRLNVVWDVLTDDLPKLIEDINHLLLKM